MEKKVVDINLEIRRPYTLLRNKRGIETIQTPPYKLPFDHQKTSHAARITLLPYPLIHATLLIFNNILYLFFYLNYNRETKVNTRKSLCTLD